MAPVPTQYQINVPDDQLEWIKDRIRTTRVSQGRPLPSGKEWSWGMSTEEAIRLHAYWIQSYDWRKVEAKLNDELKMFTLPIDHHGENIQLHFVHHRSYSQDAIPLLFIHGWPGNFLEVRGILKSLVSPSDSTSQAYHVVAPSLPGFGFSSYPSSPCSPMDMAAMMNKLMQSLGYTRYMVQGGDWGSMIARIVALDFPSSCLALHLNLVVATLPSPFRHPLQVGKLALAWLSGGRNLTTFEKRMLARMQWWMKDESGYSAIQGTKPYTINAALADSPFGMMCWIRDKLESLKEETYKWDDEDVITWSMIYIINGSPGHAEIYRWASTDYVKSFEDALFHRTISSEVPVGCSNFPQDVLYVPRWWAECKVASNIIFWREHEMGGHFASTETPDLLVQDIREFTKLLHSETLASLKTPGNEEDSGNDTTSSG